MSSTFHTPKNKSTDISTPADIADKLRIKLLHATHEEVVKLLVETSTLTRQHPTSIDALLLLGDLYLKVSQPYAAEQAFTAALRINLHTPRAREGIGLSFLQRSTPFKALKHFSIAHNLDPNNAEVLTHWGLALLQAGQLKIAHNRFKQSLNLNPQNSVAWLNLGVVDAKRGSWADAIRNFKHAIRLSPEASEAHHNIVLAYRQIGDLENAELTARHLTAIRPKDQNHWLLLAETLIGAGKLDEADQAIKIALDLNPADPHLHIIQSLAHRARGRHDQARAILNTGLILGHENPNIQLELATLHLEENNFKAGWPLYEARKRIVNSPVEHYPYPEWLGESLQGKTILVHPEQGLGATIAFAQCIPDLLASAAKVILLVQPTLTALFARSFPTASVLAYKHRRNAHDAPIDNDEKIDFQVAIGSLSKFFRPDTASFRQRPNYLKADNSKIDYWRTRFNKGNKPLVGLVWRAGIGPSGERRRSFSLQNWAGALSRLPVNWVSLQHGEFAIKDAEEAASDGMNIQQPLTQDMTQDDVSAITLALDLTIAVCGTQAHLTGALGAKGLILTPFNAPWMYGREQETTVWHPSLRVIRQQAPSDWGAAFMRIASELASS